MQSYTRAQTENEIGTEIILRGKGGRKRNEREKGEEERER